MVEGLERFRAELGSYSENYIVIGGTACNVVLEDVVLDSIFSKLLGQIRVS